MRSSRGVPLRGGGDGGCSVVVADRSHSVIDAARKGAPLICGYRLLTGRRTRRPLTSACAAAADDALSRWAARVCLNLAVQVRRSGIRFAAFLVARRTSIRGRIESLGISLLV